MLALQSAPAQGPGKGGQSFGPTLPTPFVRPAYKWVDSPPFPAGKQVSPQRVFGRHGNPKIIPKKIDCAHFIVKPDAFETPPRPEVL